MTKAYTMQGTAFPTYSSRPFFQSILCLFFFALLLPQGKSQQELICDGNLQTIDFSGTFQDFVIPADPTVDEIEFTLKGGDGGFAQLGTSSCKSDGGEGATVTARFKIGEEAGAIPRGATLRFVVGRAGEKGTATGVLFTGSAYGGGGGGTGLLYKMPDDPLWTILAVAGGGGGAYQGRLAGFCVNNKEGYGGNTTEAGLDGDGGLNPGDGGTFGDGGRAGGLAGLELSGGGGGYLTRGGGIRCNGSDVGQGEAGYPEGGAGGGSDGCFSFVFRDGGYGFGGGGTGNNGGGGGGGYSGGGGGGSTGAGGGGGSYVKTGNIERNIIGGGTTGETFDGFATYNCLRKSAPVAVCIPTPLTIALDDTGNARITLSQIDGGTIEASTGEVAISFGPANFDCDDIGENGVTLTVTADSGLASTCTATVIVEDNTAPVANCESLSIFLDKDGLATITPEQIGGSSTDACGIAEMSIDITSFDCNSLGEQTVVLSLTDNNGNTNSCFSTLKIKDEIPTTISCPNDQVVSCGQSIDISALGEATATDNCSTPTVAFTDEGETDPCGESTTLLRTWTASLDGAVITSCIQRIDIQKDNTPPTITCPATTTEACNTNELPSISPTVMDNCDSEPLLAYEDETIGNEGDLAYTIERLWTATDACGNVSACVQTINKSASILAEEALGMDMDGDGEADPLVIGRLNRNALIITPDAAACILEWLPSAPGSSRPLPRGNTTATAADCTPGRIPINEEGRLTNPLLGQAIQLGLTLRLQPDIADVPLSTLSCMGEVSSIVYQGLPRPNPTVGDLFKQSNLILGNIYAPHWQHFENALSCINSVYGLCKPTEDEVAPLHIQTTQAQAIQTPLDIAVFPNPAQRELYVQFNTLLERPAVLQVYNLQGQVAYKQTILGEGSIQQRIDLPTLASGLYKVVVQLEDGQRIVKSLVVEQ